MAAEQWLAELDTAGVSSYTLRNYRANIASALESMGADVELEDITRNDVAMAMSLYRGKDGKVRKGSTMSSYLTAMRSFFTWCVEAGLLEHSPAVRIKSPKVGKRVPKAMSAHECASLLQAAKGSRYERRDTLLVMLALTMGLRLSELANVRIEDFSPNADSAESLLVRGKGDKERAVPVPAVTAKLIGAHCGERTGGPLFMSERGEGLSRDGVGQVFDRLLRKAGIKREGRRVHAARHSFATAVLDGGADVTVVAELLGHASVATTQIYLKVNPARLTQAVEASLLAQEE